MFENPANFHQLLTGINTMLPRSSTSTSLRIWKVFILHQQLAVGLAGCANGSMGASCPLNIFKIARKSIKCQPCCKRNGRSIFSLFSNSNWSSSQIAPLRSMKSPLARPGDSNSHTQPGLIGNLCEVGPTAHDRLCTFFCNVFYKVPSF